MQKTLMKGLNQKGMEAVVNTYDLKTLYYPTLFPLKQTYGLTVKALEVQVGLRLAADLVARGASLDAKTREAISKVQADLPKIAIKRVKDENELNEYDIMVAMTSGDANLRQLVDAWAEDTQYCWDGVANRLEWLALQSFSRGSVAITNANNDGPISEFDMDYSIPSDQKMGYTADKWANPETAKPITKDFKAVVKAARAKGINLKYAFMSQETFSVLAQTDEVVKLAHSYIQNLANMAFTPSLEAVNAALNTQAYLHGLQIIVIDQDVTIEKANGERVTANPFEEGKVTFTESKVVGNTYYKTPADMNLQGSKALMTLNGHTLIKKYSTDEPITEVTVGIANALPVWTASSRSYLFDSENATFTLK